MISFHSQSEIRVCVYAGEFIKIRVKAKRQQSTNQTPPKPPKKAAANKRKAHGALCIRAQFKSNGAIWLVRAWWCSFVPHKIAPQLAFETLKMATYNYSWSIFSQSRLDLKLLHALCFNIQINAARGVFPCWLSKCFNILISSTTITIASSPIITLSCNLSQGVWSQVNSLAMFNFDRVK